MNTELYFRQGFVEKLAERGVSPDRVSAALDSLDDSSGLNKSSNIMSNIASGTGDFIRGLGFTGLFGPAIIAGIAGYMLNTSKRVSPADLQAKKDLMALKELEEQRRTLAETL